MAPKTSLRLPGCILVALPFPAEGPLAVRRVDPCEASPDQFLVDAGGADVDQAHRPAIAVTVNGLDPDYI